MSVYKEKGNFPSTSIKKSVYGKKKANVITKLIITVLHLFRILLQLFGVGHPT